MEWIDTVEAARILGVSRQRVAQLIAKGRLHSHIFSGRHHVLERSDVERFRDNRPVTKTYPAQGLRGSNDPAKLTG